MTCSILRSKPLSTSASQVAILMGTYQGERFIDEQLESIQNQTYKYWHLWISDDGSKDATLDKVNIFKQQHSTPVTLLHGPRKGFAHNFLSLLCNEQIDAEYYCFADQDDIWHSDKLERAICWLQSQPPEQPALYCSRTELIDEQRQMIGHSPLFQKTPCFSNALAQNIGGGNTMVMNRAARKLICQAGLVNVVSHDWWVYIVVTGCDGNIYYDPKPSLNYRQHTCNLIGSNTGWEARLRRIHKLVCGQYRDWNDLHIQAIEPIRHILSPINNEKLKYFKQLRNTNLINRLWKFKHLGLHRQTFMGNIGLLAAVFLKKI